MPLLSVMFLELWPEWVLSGARLRVGWIKQPALCGGVSTTVVPRPWGNCERFTKCALFVPFSCMRTTMNMIPKVTVRSNSQRLK